MQLGSTTIVSTFLRRFPVHCAAHFCYRHTSLGPSEDEFVSQFTDYNYASFMREWEHKLNHVLTTGQKLPSDRA